MPVAAAASEPRSWPCASVTEAFSSTPTRNAPNRPRSVMYAAMPRNTNTMSDLRLPPPMRISVLEPQPEPSVMPTPNRNPPTRYESHVKLGDR
jgi:hypothetical protein